MFVARLEKSQSVNLQGPRCLHQVLLDVLRCVEDPLVLSRLYESLFRLLLQMK